MSADSARAQSAATDGVAAHGIANWPFGRGTSTTALPDALPDGRPWPVIAVVVLAADGRADFSASLASIEGQGYPRLRSAIVRGVCPRETGETTEGADFVLVLRAGDLLAPGALAALAVEAVLSGADAVAGLRVLFDGAGVHGLDILSAASGGSGCDAGPAPFAGGEVLFSARALAERQRRDDGGIADAAFGVWQRLAERPAARSRIGRPVLLQRASRPARDRTGQGLRVAALTDHGYRGGAGIAHRRLAEALELAGHRVTPIRLGDEASPAAAEWTEAFPRTQALIEAGHDMVLAGNLHGATRSLSVLGRLSETMPVACVLHDLFPLTGRCAHPKDCTRIARGCDARCPNPDEFPQLAPGRIAGIHAGKRAVLAAPRRPLLLANSDWTRARAQVLAPPGADIARVTLAFPTGIFRPGDRAALRRRLGLPVRDVLVLFGAVIADAPDKGFDDLRESLRAVARPGIGFVAIGRLDDPAALGLANLHAPGPIASEARLAEWYAACDLVVTASRLETLGQMPIEAGLCGTPALAYRTTGLTSAIVDGVTGVLVDPAPGALAEALAALIADAPRRERLGAFARIVLESRFSHASAAISLHEVFAAWKRLDRSSHGARIAFSPDMLGRFAFAARRFEGAADTVAAPARPLVRALRRIKHAVLGHEMPLWLRYGLYLSERVRRLRRTEPRR